MEYLGDFQVIISKENKNRTQVINNEIISLDINKEKAVITPINKNTNKEEITIPKMPDLF